MFGYVTIDAQSLPEPRRHRYQAAYCGLCHTLREEYGGTARMTLSYDITFLYLLLSSLYEPAETEGEAFCPLHPLKKRPWMRNEIASYLAAMNVALAYFKSVDDWRDERSASGLAGSRMLRAAYEKVERAFPEKCAFIAEQLAGIASLEAARTSDVDALSNRTGAMLGEIYVWKPDLWSPPLRAMGESLGRFIYLMDAYEDLPSDERRRRFNPLRELKRDAQYDAVCRDALSLLIAECTDAFEVLPLEKDMDILRNVLYSGVWARYAQIQRRVERKRGLPVRSAKAQTGGQDKGGDTP